jgi:hypothetical protein
MYDERLIPRQGASLMKRQGQGARAYIPRIAKTFHVLPCVLPCNGGPSIVYFTSPSTLNLHSFSSLHHHLKSCKMQQPQRAFIHPDDRPQIQHDAHSAPLTLARQTDIRMPMLDEETRFTALFVLGDDVPTEVSLALFAYPGSK